MKRIGSNHTVPKASSLHSKLINAFLQYYTDLGVKAPLPMKIPYKPNTGKPFLLSATFLHQLFIN